MDPEFPIWLAFLFPILFVAIWVSVMRVISWMGWSGLADRFAFDREVPPNAVRYGAQSLALGGKRFGTANYGNCVNIWVDQRGLYLRPQLLFRMFHPLIHIRWDQIASAEVRTGFLKRGTQLRFRADVPDMVLRGRSGQVVADRWQATGTSQGGLMRQKEN